MTTALLDSDILSYELGFAGQTYWDSVKKEQGQYDGSPPPWEVVEEMLNGRIDNICALVESDKPPIALFTGKNNFRNFIAKRFPYKDRVGNKPWHYYNIRAYLKGKFEWRLEEGLEADDLFSIMLTENPEEYVACSRDKDVRTCPGKHFGWELNRQPQFGPMLVDELGRIELAEDRKKVKGYGNKFFYAQCLTGDTVDSVKGLPRCGPVRAFELLNQAQTVDECFQAVLSEYGKKYEESALTELTEQARLLYMVRKFEEGKALMWSPPQYDKEDWIDISSGEIEVRAKRG